MNFVSFPVGTTNLWPLANDTFQRGQLMTEYNLRSRESVSTDETVSYMIGPSFVHDEDSFYVRLQQDGAGTTISTSTLEILPGRAVINGHFFESLATVEVDLLQGNADEVLAGNSAISGALCIGLRAMYSTEQTMAGAMLQDNENFYEGVQVVVLPKSEFLLPTDVPNEEDKVTAHLLLATFNYVNSSVNTLVNNYPDKLRWLEASRINNVESLLSSIYISKTGLNPKKLYVFSGKSSDSTSELDTWCDAVDSLMVWDNDPTLTTTAPSVNEAAFGTNTNGKTQLIVPHKQVDGMTNTAGTAQYYADKVYDLPLADFNGNTAGTVDKSYTGAIKEIANKLQNIYRMPNGKQVGYLDSLDDVDDLPTINSNWDIGDYIIVGTDNTLEEETDGVKAPSTMYVVIPGQVTSYTYHSYTKNTTTVPSALTGMELAVSTWDSTSVDPPNTSDSDTYLNYFSLSTTIRGVVGEDYFVICYTDGETTYRYYYVVSAADDYQYSDPVWVTGEIPFAQEAVIGGFYNVTDTDVDNGYVYRDDTGHLVLLDYSLLRSGTLAYQLGEDYTVTSGLTTEEVQTYLDEYVNERVAFGNATHLAEADDPKTITITIPLSAEDEATTLNIYNIDSRFNTSVYIYITGDADENTTINIVDCEKVRINSNIGGTPVVNLYRSNLYYDASVIDYLNEIEGMKLWYQQYESTDANLLIDNMTVRECDPAIISEEIDYWSEQVVNDNHFMFALQSVTFGPDGSIVGAGIFVKNETTANLSEGDSIVVSDFELPQGAAFEYPPSKLTNQIKITGTFCNAYAVDEPAGYMVLDTNFSALTNTYDISDTTNNLTGVIAFHVRAQYVTSVIGIDLGTAIDSWESNSYHTFYGVTLG